MAIFAALPRWLEDWARDQPLYVQIPVGLAILFALLCVVVLWKRWTGPKPPTPSN